MQIDKVQALFVVGHAQSGTSLVNDLICVHPDIAGGNETRLFRHFYDMFEYSEARKRRLGIYAFHKDTNFVFDLIKRFTNEYFTAFAQQAQKPAFVEKTPSHAICLPLISYCFPDRQFHIIRYERLQAELLAEVEKMFQFCGAENSIIIFVGKQN